jgi:hypothetical protein
MTRKTVVGVAALFAAAAAWLGTDAGVIRIAAQSRTAPAAKSQAA